VSDVSFMMMSQREEAVRSKYCFLMSLWFLMKKCSSSHHEGVDVEIGALCVMKLGGDDDVGYDMI
jgi:hypothetical protein